MDDELTGIVSRAAAPLDVRSAQDTLSDARGLDAAGVRTARDLLEVGPDRPADGRLRVLAYWLLGRCGLAGAQDTLVRGLEDPDSAARREAVAALGGMPLTDATPVIRRLEQLLSADPDVGVRVAAALALGPHAESAAGTLILALRDFAQPPSVRGAAAEALAQHRGDVPRPALLDALRDDEPEVRGWAAFAVGERGDREALPRLDELAATDQAPVPGLGTVADEAREAAAAIRSQANG